MVEINLVINAIFNWYSLIFTWIREQHPIVQACFWLPIALLVVLIFFKFIGKDKGV